MPHEDVAVVADEGAEVPLGAQKLVRLDFAGFELLPCPVALPLDGRDQLALDAVEVSPRPLVFQVGPLNLGDHPPLFRRKLALRLGDAGMGALDISLVAVVDRDRDEEPSPPGALAEEVDRRVIPIRPRRIEQVRVREPFRPGQIDILQRPADAQPKRDQVGAVLQGDER